MAASFRPVSDAQSFSQSLRSRLHAGEDDSDGIDGAPAFASPASWRPNLLLGMRPPTSSAEASSPASFEAGEKSARMAAELARKRGARPVDANAVAARVYELMRQEARLAKMRGAWGPQRRSG